MTTGIIFGLLSALHVWRGIAERQHLADPMFLLQIVITVVLPGVFAWWAWRLLRKLSSDHAKR
jgi:tetrahydromethanopterin S-methyltransferase subunit E